MLENTRNTRGITSVANVWGLAASAASLVALSCDTINISPHGSIMYHSAWNSNGNGNVDDGIKAANAAQLSILSNRIKKLSEKEKKANSKKNGVIYKQNLQQRKST